MKLRIARSLACLSVVLTSHGLAAAQATSWDEATNGDFSNDGLAPTTVQLVTGGNRVTGTTGNSGQGVDRDYFRFSVPAGSSLTSLKLLGNTSVSGSSSFIAFQAGPQVTVTPTGGGSEALMGFSHYGNDMVGRDIFSAIFGSGSGLPAGTYSVWVQETGGPVSYEFDFGVATEAGPAGDVPTLPEWGVLLLAALMLVSAWKRMSPGRN